MILEISAENVPPPPPNFQFQFAMVTNYFRIKSRPALLMIRRPSLWRRYLPSSLSVSPPPLEPRALMVTAGFHESHFT